MLTVKHSLWVGSQDALKHIILKLKPFLCSSHEGQSLPWYNLEMQYFYAIDFSTCSWVCNLLLAEHKGLICFQHCCEIISELQEERGIYRQDLFVPRWLKEAYLSSDRSCNWATRSTSSPDVVLQCYMQDSTQSRIWLSWFLFHPTVSTLL